MSVLAHRLIAVHAALDAAGLAHAFGGAIALAYCTHEPRGTRDLDVNIFVGVDRAGDAFDAMPDEVRVTKADRTAARRDGQVRLMWDDTPIDVFFNTHEFHVDAAAGIRPVPFEGTTIPVLSCDALVVFKAMFNRTRDWADIEAIMDAEAIDVRAVLTMLHALLGPTDPVVVRFETLAVRPR